jgi:hypothetical protein
MFHQPPTNVSNAFQIWLVFPHPLVPSLLHGVCTHPINPLGIHLLECAHDNEYTWPHDAMQDVVALIA